MVHSRACWKLRGIGQAARASQARHFFVDTPVPPASACRATKTIHSQQGQVSVTATVTTAPPPPLLLLSRHARVRFSLSPYPS